MPYPNEHSARVLDPGDFEKRSMRSKKIGSEGVRAIMGHLKGKTTMTVQAYRFPKDKFTVAQAKKWLKDNKVEFISFEPAKEMSKGSLESDSKIIKRENGKIYVSGVLQKTGVFNGGLKPWEEWRESIPLMAGTEIIRGEHPTDPETGDFISISDPRAVVERIGRILEAQEDAKNQLARGIYELDESSLTPAEIQALEKGRPIGTSPGYWCEKDIQPAPKLWKDGTPYTFIERKSFLYDHFATPRKPACTSCGMLINSWIGEDIIGKQRLPEEIKEAVAQLPKSEEPAFLVNQAIDEVVLQNSILDILECNDDFKKGQEALSLLVQILRTILAVPEQNGLAAMSQAKPKNKTEDGMVEEDKGGKALPDDVKLLVNAAVEELIKPVQQALGKAEETVAQQAKTIAEQTEKLTKIETAEAARSKHETEAATAAATAAEETKKKTFLDKLKPGIAKTTEEATKIWDAAKADLGSWILANPDKMAFSINADLKYAPKGQPLVPGMSTNSSKEDHDKWFIDQGIKPASELAKELYPEGK